MGAVTLQVGNLDAVSNFYTEGVGLKVLQSTETGLALGSTEKLVFLEQAPQLKRPASNEAGLFHTAFLFDTESDLARAVAQVAALYPDSFTGSADHLVSKAFYFNDPEGNGVELYWDRPRESWTWNAGQVKMDTLHLDPNAFLGEHLADEIAGDIAIGHVHLSVGNLEQAREFYLRGLGFDLTLNYGAAAMFVSAGGYHHHMAMNIWHSRGAGRRTPSLGLGQVRISLGSEQARAEMARNLTELGFVANDDGRDLITYDPWGNQLLIRA
jgi:catechol 2,3-dioxygenase